jgi:Cu-Zn family superoxide dismutase
VSEGLPGRGSAAQYLSAEPGIDTVFEGGWFMARTKRLAPAVLAVLAAAFVWTSGVHGQKGEMKQEGPIKAICLLTPTKDSKVSGVVMFTRKGDAIEITGEITGLTPGLHGFHVHEYGDLNSPDGMATGGHFNPDKKMHGGPRASDRHVGDLGNVEADKSGKVKLHMTDKVIQLHGPHSIIGRGLIVHAKADDLKSQPTGDAGGRVAQGVVGVAK